MKLTLFFNIAFVFALSIVGAGAGPVAQLPFQFLDNRIFIPVSLNGHGPYSFILDTGSSDWDVSKEIVGQLGLRRESTMTVNGAGENTAQSDTLHVARTEVGDASFRNQAYYSTDFGILTRVIGFEHFDGIAGAQVFNAYAISIDFDRKLVQLDDAATYKAPRGAIRIPFTTLDGSTPLVSGRIAGVDGKFIVDTGDRSSLTLFGPFWRAHKLDRKFAPGVNALTGYGVGGPIRGLVVRVPEFEFGDAKVSGVVARLSLQKSGGFADPAIAGSIGNGVLRRFHVTFDYAHKQIVLQPDANFATADEFDRSGLWLGRDASGFPVYDARAGSPASRAGVKIGDVVVAIDGMSATQIDLFALRARLADPKESQPVIITYKRGAKTMTARLTLRDLLPG